MASEIDRLKAKFETNNGSSPKTPSKPLPSPPSKTTEKTTSVPYGASLEPKRPGNVGGGGGSLKIKPTTTTKNTDLPSGKSGTLPSKPPTLIGTPPTTKSAAASHISSVLELKSKSEPSSSSPGKVVGGRSGSVTANTSSGVEITRNRRPSDTRKSGFNGVAAASPNPPSKKLPVKPLNVGKHSVAPLHNMSSSPKGSGKLVSPLKEKGTSSNGSSSSSSSSTGRSNSSQASGNVQSVFGVKLNHREKDSAPPQSPSSKTKPLHPPAFRDVKFRSSPTAHTGGSSTDDGADKSSRDERASSVPRDIELSGSEVVPVTKKLPRTPPSQRPKSVENFKVDASKTRSTSDLSKEDGATSNGQSKKYKPRPPPKKPGLPSGDKPSPPPKPTSLSSSSSRSPSRSPSRVPPKPPISKLKNSADFSRPRRDSTPSSRESTPSLGTPTPDESEQKSRSRSFTPLGSQEGSQIGDGSLEETLKCPTSGRGHSASTTSWVMIDEPRTKGGSKSPPTSKGGSPSLKKRRIPPIPPQSPTRVKSPETNAIDESKSPSVNALRNKFGDRSSNIHSPPTSPASPITRSGTPPKRVGENRFSSPTSGPTITVKQPEVNRGDSPSLNSNKGRSVNVDSGFISEVPDDLTSVGQATSSENVSETMETPPTPLSPSSQAEEPVVEEVWDEARLEKAKLKRSKIAQELLDTEKTYVHRLKLIAKDFYGVVKPYSEKSKGSLTDSEVMQIFLNIQQIHQLNETMLQDLENRIASWSTDERIGDVICRLAPFLKLYSHYTSGFEEAMKTLTECTKKDKKFDSIVRDFERTTISTGLGVAHYMLEPVQRIPRYRLLLVDYLKYLPPDSPDKPDTKKALGIISEAADRNNDRIKELEISNDILSIQRSLTEYNGMLLQPSREFIKKGHLQKMSRKNLTQRMFFLFSDVLIHTYPAHNGVYKFKDEMALCEMHIQAPEVSLFPHSFEVHSRARSLLLVAMTEEEKNEWMEALDSAINDDIRKRRSLRRETFVMKRSEMKKFGYKAPIMVPDKSVSMCQVCSTEFTVLFRRHHCRACGKVVCSNCSQKKAYLQYLQKLERICEACYTEYRKESTNSLDEIDGSKTSSPKAPKKQDSAPGVLNLKAYDQAAVIAGYVLSQEGRKFNRIWYQVRQDCVLYKFRAHEDIKAYHSLPLPGYVVKPDVGNSTIQLLHPSKKKELCDTFKVEDDTAFKNWSNTLEKVVRMEIPSPTHQPQRNSRLSQSFEDSYSTGNQSPHTIGASFEVSGNHSRPDSFESYSSGSFREGSPEVSLDEQHQT